MWVLAAAQAGAAVYSYSQKVKGTKAMVAAAEMQKKAMEKQKELNNEEAAQRTTKVRIGMMKQEGRIDVGFGVAGLDNTSGSKFHLLEDEARKGFTEISNIRRRAELMNEAIDAAGTALVGGAKMQAKAQRRAALAQLGVQAASIGASWFKHNETMKALGGGEVAGDATEAAEKAKTIADNEILQKSLPGIVSAGLSATKMPGAEQVVTDLSAKQAAAKQMDSPMGLQDIPFKESGLKSFSAEEAGIDTWEDAFNTIQPDTRFDEPFLEDAEAATAAFGERTARGMELQKMNMSIDKLLDVKMPAIEETPSFDPDLFEPNLSPQQLIPPDVKFEEDGTIKRESTKVIIGDEPKSPKSTRGPAYENKQIREKSQESEDELFRRIENQYQRFIEGL